MPNVPSPPLGPAVVSTLLSLMDGLTYRGSVIVIGATNRWGWGPLRVHTCGTVVVSLASPSAILVVPVGSACRTLCALSTAVPVLQSVPATGLAGELLCRPEAIDPALRRPGRFDREVSLLACPAMPDGCGQTYRGHIFFLQATALINLGHPLSCICLAACLQVYFGLPTPVQRLAILCVHTQRWGRPPPPKLLQQVRGRRGRP